MGTQRLILSGRDQSLEFAGYGFRAHHPLFQSIREKSTGGNQTSSGMCRDVHRESELMKITVTSSGRAPDLYRTSSINLRGTCEPSLLRQTEPVRCWTQLPRHDPGSLGFQQPFQASLSYGERLTGVEPLRRKAFALHPASNNSTNHGKTLVWHSPPTQITAASAPG